MLVIEDEPLIRDIFTQFLERLGYEADVATDGCEGLARFDPLRHEIVITDFVMPGLTGLAVAEAIRARGHTTPIMMISGSATPCNERQATRAGVRVLRKPIGFAQFQAALTEVVEYAYAGRSGGLQEFETRVSWSSARS